MKGFTLIELLVTISIIAVLVTISLVSFSSVQKRARDDQRTHDLNSLKQSLEIYYSQHKSYPDPTGFYGSAMSSYISPEPKDPLTGDNYSYNSAAPTPSPSGAIGSYVLCSIKESDPPQVTPAGCGSCGTTVCGQAVTSP